MTERLKKDIIKLVIDEVVIEGESVKIFATIPLPNKIHEREMDKTDIPGTFNAGATLGPVNETNMARIWNKHKQTNTPLKRKVFVGVSGGVDSAVAAALLKKQGYDVAGVFMRFWKPEPRINADSKGADKRGYENSCCSVESEAKARLVAGKFGIPFYIFNFAKEFKREVVDYFLAELAAGRTPNPCAVCNPQIKFGLFLERAKKLGADFVATGHYVKTDVIASPARAGRGNPEDSSDATGLLRRVTPFERSDAPRNDLVGLFMAKDKQKDQSYFLAGLSQEQLSKIIWPLGNYTKPEVYKLAKKWHLPHQARQSFDICFAGDYKGFLRRYLKMREGKIVSSSVIPAKVVDPGRAGIQIKSGPGSRVTRLDSHARRARREPGMTKEIILGKHQGLPLYTIGQRAGIGGPGPFYVVKKDAKKNILYVSNNEKDLLQKEMMVKNVNWLSGQRPKLPLKCKVKIRYQGEGAAKSLVAKRKSQIVVTFDRPQRAITPGQLAVFYGRGGEVLGGGVIKG